MLDHVNTEFTKYEPYRESQTAGEMKNKGVGGFPHDVSYKYVKLKASTPDRSDEEDVEFIAFNKGTLICILHIREVICIKNSKYFWAPYLYIF